MAVTLSGDRAAEIDADQIRSDMYGPLSASEVCTVPVLARYVMRAFRDRCPVVVVGYSDKQVENLRNWPHLNPNKIPLYAATQDTTLDELKEIKNELECRLAIISRGPLPWQWKNSLESMWLSPEQRREALRQRRQWEKEQREREERKTRKVEEKSIQLTVPSYVWGHLMYEDPSRHSPELDLCGECGAALAGFECSFCGLAVAA